MVGSRQPAQPTTIRPVRDRWAHLNEWCEQSRDRFASIYQLTAVALILAGTVTHSVAVAGTSVWFALAATVLRYAGRNRL